MAIVNRLDSLRATSVDLVGAPANRRNRWLLKKGADYQDEHELALLLRDGLLEPAAEAEARRVLKASGVPELPPVVSADDDGLPDDEPEMETTMDPTDKLVKLLKSAIGRENIEKAAAAAGRATWGSAGLAGLDALALGELRSDPLLPMAVARSRAVKTARGGALLGMTLSPLADLPLDVAITKAASEHSDFALSLAAALGANVAAVAKAAKANAWAGADPTEESDSRVESDGMLGADFPALCERVKAAHPTWTAARIEREAYNVFRSQGIKAAR